MAYAKNTTVPVERSQGEIRNILAKHIVLPFEEEFLAHIVLPNGEVFGELYIPQIDSSYQNNEMPPLLEGRS